MANSCSIENIVERQCDKLRYLESAAILVQDKHAVKDVLMEMVVEVSKISDNINKLREQLCKMSDRNKECQELLLLVQTLDDKIVHMERNVPPQLIHNYHHTNDELNLVLKEILSNHTEESTNDKSNIESQSNENCPMKNCKKILFSEPDVYPKVAVITKDEFNTVPKYLIGRQSIETVNSLVETINQVLKAKYTLLSLGKEKVRKQGNMELYLQYKKQELDICTKNEYLYFFTNQDYEMYTKTKLNKIKFNLLTVLRHCKRLREHRVKNDVRYVVVT
ncbi:SKA complex subunit 1 [Lasioglossum baleicum]|uniref:SKA complex subunit 1 n=1 Tax=Lasioglossum baleicum TaxID=434251 RepID=UPI003FCCF68F